jgi:hypothetical protein
MNQLGWIRSGIRVGIAALCAALAGCGGGTSTSGTGTSGVPALGPTTIDISLNAGRAPVSTAEPVPGAGHAWPASDPAYRWSGEIRELGPRIAHVYVEVVKVSLMPAEEAFEGEGTEGDIEEGTPPREEAPPDKPRFVSIVPETPVLVDLLGLEDGQNLATLYGKFDQVPAGTYDKIRVRYRSVKVELADGRSFRFHPAGRHKFDIRFLEGRELVIPAAAEAPPEGWLNYFRVKLTVAGIKIKIVRGGKFWKGCRVVLRPQIFAEADPPVIAEPDDTPEPPPPANLIGTADQVQVDSKLPPVAGRFNVLPVGGAAAVPVVFDDNTVWSWSDNVLSGSGRTVAVSDAVGIASFRNGATVEIIAYPGSAPDVPAAEIRVTFPAAVAGTVDPRGWNDDNFFQLLEPAGYSVYPQPKRYTAYYDNAAAPHGSLTDAAIVPGARVTARGYRASVGEGIQAYWISVGEAVAAGP